MPLTGGKRASLFQIDSASETFGVALRFVIAALLAVLLSWDSVGCSSNGKESCSAHKIQCHSCLRQSKAENNPTSRCSINVFIS